MDLPAQPPPSIPEPSSVKNAPTSGLAVASLVCGVLALVTVLPFLPAIICGHLALAKIRRANGALAGRGFAIAGLVLGYLLPVIVATGLFFPAFASVKERAREAQAQVQLRALTVGCQQYAMDHGDKFPPTLEALFPDYIIDRKLLTSEFPEPGSFEYFGDTAKSQPEAILAATKYSKRHHRVVAHVDGTVEIERDGAKAGH